ncbi:hypothetical protein Clacol_000453 [Clathrus columnatus]|uniref:X-box-binding protein 1 n=1 Tax=Clathrus columnatus TaxID=1419009 RepID=A0AAV4ZYH0_9AGAM|nr:hypothetical protein Clacol_000453 [Clathrus columnatus]
MKRTSPSPSYVDPSSLSLPSPLSDDIDVSSPAPAASSSSINTPASAATPSTSTQSSRKRPRTETSPEEKREARAHRNRIAAQNSRDRRKAQFTQLEERVQALQRENEQLRAELQRERERRDNAEKEKENAELKERVKSLEQAWEPVLKAFQSQGLPSSLFAPKSSSSSQSPDPKPDPPTTTFPVFIESPPVLPLTPLSVATASSTVYNQPGLNDSSIRHLARVAGVPAADGSTHSPALSTLDLDAPFIVPQEVFDNSSHTTTDNRIEHWFSQMLSSNRDGSTSDAIATSPSAGLSFTDHCSKSQQYLEPGTPTSSTPSLTPLDFSSGSIPGDGFNLGLGDDMDMVMEMDRLLDLLPETIDNSCPSNPSNEEFQDLLASVLDDSTVVESREWSSNPHLGTPLSVSEENTTSLVVQ